MDEEKTDYQGVATLVAALAGLVIASAFYMWLTPPTIEVCYAKCGGKYDEAEAACITACNGRVAAERLPRERRRTP